jgi:PAS domain S-box-containing protein
MPLGAVFITRGYSRGGNVSKKPRKREFEKTLYNAIIYGLGMVLSKYDAFSAEIMVKDLGRYIREYLASEDIDIVGGRTPEETQRKIVQAFADKGFVEELDMKKTREGRIYAKWRGLLGVEAYNKLFSETENPFISCPLNAVLLEALDRHGITMRVHDLTFNLEDGSAETVEELTPKKRAGDLKVSNPVVLENIRLYELARRRALELERERKNLDNIVSGIGADIFLLDEDFRVTWANKKMLDKYGDILGTYCYKSYCNLEELPKDCPAQETFNQGCTVQQERIHSSDDGRETQHLHTCSPIKDKGGKVSRVLELVQDVTERKTLENQLRIAKEYLENLVDSSADAILTVDLHGNVAAWNKGAERMFGWKAEEVIGERLPHVPSELSHEIGWMIDLVGKGRKLSDYETVRLHKDGRRINVSTTVSPIRDSNGNIIGASGILRDITRRKKTEEKLMEYARQLEYSNKLKDLFSDILRHDMLNPVSVIDNVSELSGNESLDDLRQRLKLANKSAKRLEEMIEKASKFVRLENAVELEFRKGDLNAIFKKVVRSFKPLIEKKGIKLEYRSNGSCMAEVNPVIEEVFANLLSNAVKYSSSGGRVVVDFQNENNHWTVIVADHGIGIPDEHKETIFERFERGERGGIKGMGLGLAIVKRAVELHKGRVWVEDNPGGGSVFYVKIPKIRR